QVWSITHRDIYETNYAIVWPGTVHHHTCLLAGLFENKVFADRLQNLSDSLNRNQIQLSLSKGLHGTVEKTSQRQRVYQCEADQTRVDLLVMVVVQRDCDEGHCSGHRHPKQLQPKVEPLLHSVDGVLNS